MSNNGKCSIKFLIFQMATQQLLIKIKVYLGFERTTLYYIVTLISISTFFTAQELLGCFSCFTQCNSYITPVNVMFDAITKSLPSINFHGIKAFNVIAYDTKNFICSNQHAISSRTDFKHNGINPKHFVVGR